MARTAVVILNLNTKDYLEAFLPALIKSTKGLDAEVVVADNGSSDGSLSLVGEKFPCVRTIALDENTGFTGGYNRAIARLLDGEDAPEYIVLINSDIEVDESWLESLIAQLDSDPQCGVCGPKLHKLLYKDGSYHRSTMFEYAGAAGGLIDRNGFPFCRGRILGRVEEDKGQYDDADTAVFWISGACLATRASLWRELGGLDQRFFAHMEEIDFCWRAALKGFSVRLVPQSVVYHIGGGTLGSDSPFKLRLNYRNCLMMLENNLPRTVGAAAARKRLKRRMCIDNCAALAYLLLLKWESFKAVRQAHREFKALSRGLQGDAVVSPLAGMQDVSIFAEYFRKR